jgi:hypothetical protein
MNLHPPTAASGATGQMRSEPSTRLRGPWLAAARFAWIALVGLGLVVFVSALPVFFQAQRTPLAPGTPLPGQLPAADVHLLQHWGVSLDLYAAYQTSLVVLAAFILTAAGALLFWRKSDDRLTFFVSLWFVMFGLAGSPVLDPLVRAHATWQIPVRLLQGAILGGFPIFTYLFPDGRFVPHWTRALTFAWSAWIVISPFTPFPVADFAGASMLWFGVLVPAGMGIGILAQIYRYLRVSGRVERQQTKWVVFGFCVVAGGFVLYSLAPVVVPAVREPGLARVLYLNFAEAILLVCPWCVLLACIGIAILRYRLWDIDPIINRALVYTSLTLSLGLVYFGSVVLLERILSRFTGQMQEQQIIVVGATLLIAALFQPLRRRIQATIDRRFYRRKYDATQTLQAFSTRLRDEVDLNRLTEDLLNVVEETMQPAHVSVWIRNGPATRATGGKADSRLGSAGQLGD